MSVSAISNTQQTAASYKSTSAAKSQSTSESASTAANESGVVYEKSEVENGSSSSVKKTYTPNTELVQKLKSDQAAQQQNLLNIVNKMMNKQATAYGQANSGSEDMWQFLASGNFTVDAATKAQAQADIAEDGYWGVNQTSERILDFANALTGGDPDKIEDMRDAFLKGYKQAEKTWGGSLPEISKQTYEAVLKGFDKMAEEAGVTLSDIDA